MWCIHATEYLSRPQRKDILTERYSMGELEDTMLGEVSQSQKDRYCVTALT